jgi:hypothetical protein
MLVDDNMPPMGGATAIVERWMAMTMIQLQRHHPQRQTTSLSTVTTTNDGGGDADYDLMLRRRIADWTDRVVDEHQVFLVSFYGMGYMFAALRTARRLYYLSRNAISQPWREVEAVAAVPALCLAFLPRHI